MNIILILLFIIINLMPLNGESSDNSNNFILGACAHYAQSWEYYYMSLPLLQQAGMISVRDELTWQNIELEKDKLELPPYYKQFTRAIIKSKSTPLIILDYGNKYYDKGHYPKSDEAIKAFCRYAEYIAKQFRGQKVYYEVWNEWDNGCGNMKGPGQDAGTYTKLLKAVYPLLKSIDPECTVLGVGVSGAGIGDKTENWTKNMLKAGALNYMDGFSIHPYTHSSSCETYYNAFPESTDKLQAVLKKYNKGKDKPIYITEMGWSTTRVAKDPKKQADYLARFLLLAKTRDFIKGVWIYNLTDCVGYDADWWTPEADQRNFGILYQDYTPKPAYWAIKDISNLIINGKYTGRMNSGNNSVNILRFNLNGKNLIAVWTTKENGIWRLMFKDNKEKHSPVIYKKVGSGSSVATKWHKNSYSLYIDETPTILEGDFADTKIGKLKWIPVKKANNTVKWDGKNLSFVKPMSSKISIDRNISDWQETQNIPLKYNSLRNKNNSNDLSGNLHLKWNANNLYVMVTVKDETHYQPYSENTIWKGDSIQIAFIPECANKKNYFEIGSALSSNKIVKTYWHIPSDMTADKSVQTFMDNLHIAIKRINHETIYELAIPYNSQYFPKLSAGKTCHFSIVINNNNGKGRNEYLNWGNGIATKGKNPNTYGKLIMMP